MVVKSIHELVRKYQFSFKGSCNCNGYETLKFQNDNKMWLEWRKGQTTFKLWNADKLHTKRWEPILLLESKLEETKHVQLS